MIKSWRNDNCEICNTLFSVLNDRCRNERMNVVMYCESCYHASGHCVLSLLSNIKYINPWRVGATTHFMSNRTRCYCVLARNNNQRVRTQRWNISHNCQPRWREGEIMREWKEGEIKRDKNLLARDITSAKRKRERLQIMWWWWRQFI